MILLIIGIVVLALIYQLVVKHYSYWKDKGVQQGKPVLLFGHSWGIILRRHNFADFMQHVYYMCPGTRYCGVYQFFLRVLLIKDPELIKQITVKDFDHFTDHLGFMPVDADPLWGKNLFALEGQQWREMRTILTPSFTSSKMKSMFPLIVECAENFVQYFLKKDQGTTKVEMKDTFTRLTNDVIATTACGIKVDSLGEPDNEFYLMSKETAMRTDIWQAMKVLGYFIFPKLYKKLFKVQIYNDKVSKFFRQVIDDTVKARKEKGIVRPDMVHLLLEAQKEIQNHEDKVTDAGFAVKESVKVKQKVTKELTNEDITAQALVFFFAGFESVAGLLTFASYELAVNQDIQSRLREEIRATLNDCKGTVTYEGLLRMKYMDMVISETLRKWPNNFFLTRTCTKPYVIEPVTPDEQPLHIQKGAAVMIPVFSLHHDSKYFPDPDRFDPERFSDENGDKINPYIYIPFGVGPRNCIGSRLTLLEVKIVIFYLLTHFQLVPVEETVIPAKISKEKFFLNPEGGMSLGLKRVQK